MSKPNKMLEALGKIPRLQLTEDPVAVIGGGATLRLDGWANDVTGQGTARDKTAYNYFSPGRVLSDGEISGLYHDNDVAARMVDIVPDEMLREGFTVDVGDPKANSELADQIDALGLDDKLADAIRWGRAYGGGGLLLGADDGRSAATPLMPERARALSYVYVLDRRYLWPLTHYTEPGHPKLGQPETYMVTSPSFAAQAPVSVVHETRLVLFGGATTGIRERETNSGWDLSILQRATKVLSDFDLGWGAAALLLADGNQAVFKISGLADALSQAAASGSAGGAETFLRERLKLMDMGRSVVRAVVVDAGGAEDEPEESFERQVFPMTGIPDVLEKLMVRLAATVDVPCTRLFGISPAGLNATGESDVRGWYDRIRSQQTRKLAPKIRRIVRVALQTKAVKLDTPSAIKVTFPSLWSESPNQAATTRKVLIEGDKLLIDAGEVLPEEAVTQRLAPDGFSKELVLSPEGKAAREAVLKDELKAAAPAAGGDEIQKTALNGAQIASLVDIVAQVASGTIPRDSALASIQLSFQVSAEEAEKLLGSAGTPKFTPTPPEPAPSPFGGPPKPTPEPKPAEPAPADVTESES
jgi:phage-related protein (TIGR01555 family)